jgi:alpha 1,3-glucosidase
LIEEGKDLRQTPITRKVLKAGHLVQFGKDGEGSALIQLNPFAINVYSGEELVAMFNHKGWLQFEHLRKKDEPNTAQESPAAEKSGDQAQESDPWKERLTANYWEETFKSHTDSKPNGNTLTSSFCPCHVYSCS